MKDLGKIGEDTTYYPGSTLTVDYMKGSESVKSGDTSKDDNITSYVLEWKISYASVGAKSAEELSFVFGWLTNNQLDRAYQRTTGATIELSAASLDDLTNDTIWYSYKQLKETQTVA